MISQTDLEKDMKLFEDLSAWISSLDYSLYACGRNDGVDLLAIKKLIPKVIEALPKYLEAEVAT
jgi:hypothetical protein